MQLNARGAEKGEVLKDEGDSVRTQPKRVLNTSILRMVIIAPFTFAETVVSAQEDPVT